MVKPASAAIELLLCPLSRYWAIGTWSFHLGREKSPGNTVVVRNNRLSRESGPSVSHAVIKIFLLFTSRIIRREIANEIGRSSGIE